MSAKPIPIWCEIVCRECAATAPGRFVYGALPRRKIMTGARGAGFRFIDGEAYCSRCEPGGMPARRGPGDLKA